MEERMEVQQLKREMNGSAKKVERKVAVNLQALCLVIVFVIIWFW